jgi:hypothetical protein
VSGLFARDEDLKRRLSRARLKHFGVLPPDRDTFLAQMAACAEALKINNPYPTPSQPVEVKEIVP